MRIQRSWRDCQVPEQQQQEPTWVAIWYFVLFMLTLATLAMLAIRYPLFPIGG
jgi:hypothetical protein